MPVTWLGYYPDWDDDWSGYTPPNSDFARRPNTDGLPAPTYTDDHDHSLSTQWAQILIGLAMQAFGDCGNGNCYSGTTVARWCPDCGCGWTGNIELCEDGQRRPVPCWFCHPQPAPTLILLHTQRAAERGEHPK
jgi:hypothetical protein